VAPQGNESFGHYLTSGDIARMLHVDLKTIHNWVTQGHIQGSRTKGRHLRFERNRVVRFMREYGYPLPSHLGTTAPRVLVESSLKGAWVTSLRRAAQVVDAPGLFACSLILSAEPCEVAVVGLDQALSHVLDFCRSVSAWGPTSGIALVGVGSKPQARHAFLAAGGNATLASAKSSDVKALVQYLVGANPMCPVSAEFANPITATRVVGRR
jgi:excisionase family DNA binding protein